MSDTKQIIYIMCDTQNKNMVSCYNNPVCSTPNLDKLAYDAAVFENAYTCQPVCGPARSAIFTGLYPSSNGMYGNGMRLGAGVKTTGQYLEEEGIKCGYVGKWHLDGGDYFGFGECPDGYDKDYWYDMKCYLDELPSAKARQESRNSLMISMRDIDPEDTYAHRCVDRAIKFVEQNADKDFFLALSLDEPHDPSRCPKAFVKLMKKSKYKLKRCPNTSASLKNKPDIQQLWAKKFSFLAPEALFFGYNRGLIACNMFVDSEIGRFLDTVNLKLTAPLIIYTSDHGDMIKSHKLVGKGAAMYNETNNVPLIIKGGEFKNRRVNTPVSHVDILPTILDYFDVKKPPFLEGESLFKLKGDNESATFSPNFSDMK